MPLASGEQLGNYKIQSLIGKGGMGEVYRALDTKLAREAACCPSSELKSGHDCPRARQSRDCRRIYIAKASRGLAGWLGRH